MTRILTLEKYTIGVGDRFAHQASAQLRACMLAAEAGAAVAPVWNKSNREHTFIGSEPASVLAAAREAVEKLGWKGGWHVDADHIRIDTVDRFLRDSDFFTIDVADAIGQAAPPDAVEDFLSTHPELIGARHDSGYRRSPSEQTRAGIEAIAGKYLLAVQEAGGSIATLHETKGEGNFDHRGLDGRNRLSRRRRPSCSSSWPRSPTRRFPCRRSRRSSPAASTRASITSATSRSSRASSRDDLAVIAHAVRAYRPAGEPEAERALRQRQILDLPTHPARARRKPARACISRPPGPPGWRN